MMLNAVVFPAPFGPMMPTISHSPTEMLTSVFAKTPPKRMDTLRVSSTDIADLHLLRTSVTQVEATPAQPAHHGPDLLADPARIERAREQQQDRADHERRDLAAEVGRAGDGVEPVLEDRELVEQVTDEGAVSYTHLRAHETDSYLVCR